MSPFAERQGHCNTSTSAIGRGRRRAAFGPREFKTSIPVTDKDETEPPRAPLNPPQARWQQRLRTVSTLATLAVALPALGGFCGRLWWGFELMCHFRAQYFVGLLAGTILLVVARCYRRAVLFGVLVIVHAALLLPFYVAGDQPHDPHAAARLRLVISNVHAANEEHAKVLELVRREEPDVAVFVEVDGRWAAALAALDDGWPHARSVPQSGNFGMAIYSRLPLEDCHVESLGEDYPAIVARLRVGQAPVTIFGAHPVPPVSARVSAMRNRQLVALAQIVAHTPGEKIVAGDLNSTSWSPAFADFLAVTGLVDSRRGRGIQGSWRADLPALLRIPIDHCLVSKKLRVIRREIGPDVGSDHLPVIVDLEIPTPLE